MMPAHIEEMGVKVEYDLRKAVADADAVNVLRVQLERQNVSLFPSMEEYAAVYGVDAGIVARMKPEAIIMHPGPMNRGVEISQDVADSDRAVILQQVTNGVAVRMAVLYLVTEGAAREIAPKDLSAEASEAQEDTDEPKRQAL